MAFLPLVGHFTTPFRHSVRNHRADLGKILSESAGLGAEGTLRREMTCVYSVTEFGGITGRILFSANPGSMGKGSWGKSDNR